MSILDLTWLRGDLFFGERNTIPLVLSGGGEPAFGRVSYLHLPLCAEAIKVLMGRSVVCSDFLTLSLTLCVGFFCSTSGAEKGGDFIFPKVQAPSLSKIV